MSVPDLVAGDGTAAVMLGVTEERREVREATGPPVGPRHLASSLVAFADDTVFAELHEDLLRKQSS